jgi:hypothetical protein
MNNWDEGVEGINHKKLFIQTQMFLNLPFLYKIGNIDRLIKGE